MLREDQPLLAKEDKAPVYRLIHTIRADVTHFIDTPLSFEALAGPDLTYSLIRPLFEKYSLIQQVGLDHYIYLSTNPDPKGVPTVPEEGGSSGTPPPTTPTVSLPFCFLLTRIHFIRDENIATASISATRAVLCEILAIRLLREHAFNLGELTLALTTSWNVYEGASQEVIRILREEWFGDRTSTIDERVGNAIELAILGKAKRFIKSSSCQKVIDSIWTGRCVYQAESSHSILSDTYKRNPIHFYDPHNAPLLDHYRLKVPAIRSVLEYLNFLMLFILFFIAIETNVANRIVPTEAAFMIYALGFALEKVAAMQEHGIKVYFKGTWNGFDLAFVTTYAFYATLRLYGVVYDKRWARITGLDSLALIACLMFPRLAFVTLKNNLMVLSLRAMIVQFMALMLIAAFCFCGFLYALWTLGRNKPEAGWSVGTVAWWMLDLWFGLDATGFAQSTTFHQVLGPVLMVAYACLSNTLLLTVLVSILTNTFATINEDAVAEAMFRRAVSTIEGVKADSLFSYQPPINLIALIIMLPASYILSPRWFHKVNVFMIRTTSFPILLIIAWYERQSKRHGTPGFRETVSAVAERVYDTLPRQLKRLTFFEGADADIDLIFEIEDELQSSALDTADEPSPNNGHPFGGHVQRRLSPYTQTRPGVAPLTTHGLPHHISPPSAMVSRARLNSVMNRAPGEGPAQVFTSPLAQMYQRFDEQGYHDGAEHHVSHSPTSHHHPPIGFGITTRHRLSSMMSIHRRDRTEREGSSSGPHPSAPRRFPVMDDVLHESPPQHSGSIPTAEKIREGQEAGALPPRLDERLKKIEERQTRIENLLEKIAQSMS